MRRRASTGRWIGLFLGLVWLSPWDAAVACAPYVEERNGGATSAVFRRHTDDFRVCRVDESTYDEVVARHLRDRPPTAPAWTALALGRAVDFPWISQYLAESALSDTRWDARRGKVRRGGINDFVASRLSERAFLARLAVPFADTPYVPVGVSVEKVRVGVAEDVLPGTGRRRVPFDAQLGLNLQVGP